MSQLFISIARMHHISNPAKFRRLKQSAVNANVSGLVKTGKPGVLVFNGEKKSTREFLEAARSLRYLDFHHVDTQPVSDTIKAHLAGPKVGLQEVQDMREIIQALETMGFKEWFRKEMGMDKRD